MLKTILKRFIYPWHLWNVVRLQRRRKRIARVYDDAQLKLYHQILPGDFLHYGYFDNPNLLPLDISIRMIYQAQERYGEKVLELVKDTQSPILDIGCGMGGLLGMMNVKGWNAIGLTPDKNQAKHIREKYPNHLLECTFEDLKKETYPAHFGTVITSESLQYLNLEHSLPLIKQILKPEGRWIACDYFKIGSHGEKSGHDWTYFSEMLAKHGFKLVHEEDITPHILPTIAYIHHWGANIVVPVKDFLIEKLNVKAPGLYYALEESFPKIDAKLNKNIMTVDPVVFAENKKYVLMVIEAAL